jgi:hypothetical protein
MKIETRYSIGDKVYFMKDNIIQYFTIQAISVTTQSYYDGIAVEKIREGYSDDFYGNKNYVCEKLLFKNIEGIVEDLKNKLIENK